MLSEEMADNTGFKDCFAGGGTFFHDDSLGCGFVDTTIKGRDDLRSLGPPCYARTGGSAAGPL